MDIAENGHILETNIPASQKSAHPWIFFIQRMRQIFMSVPQLHGEPSQTYNSPQHQHTSLCEYIMSVPLHGEAAETHGSRTLARQILIS